MYVKVLSKNPNRLKFMWIASIFFFMRVEFRIIVTIIPKNTTAMRLFNFLLEKPPIFRAKSTKVYGI